MATPGIHAFIVATVHNSMVGIEIFVLDMRHPGGFHAHLCAIVPKGFDSARYQFTDSRPTSIIKSTVRTLRDVRRRASGRRHVSLP